MSGNTLGDLLNAGQWDSLKDSSNKPKASSKHESTVNITSAAKEGRKDKNPSKDDYQIFHSYVRTIVNKSELYDMMFDEGGDYSFAAVADSYSSPVCRDVIDYFACRFFEGEYEQLDSFAKDCEKGKYSCPNANAGILGHTIPLTYEELYELLSTLCSVALSVDHRFDEMPVQETVIVYKRPTSSVSKTAETKKNTDTVIGNHVKPQTQIKHGHVELVTKTELQPSPIVESETKQAQKHIAKPQRPQTQTNTPKKKTDSREKHRMRTQALRKDFDDNYYLLGITDFIVVLFGRKEYDPIHHFFNNSKKEYFNKQTYLGRYAFEGLWEKAYKVVKQYIAGSNNRKAAKKTPSHGGIVSFPRRSFSSHVASSGVWGRMADYGGTNGPIIRINVGHGR